MPQGINIESAIVESAFDGGVNRTLSARVSDLASVLEFGDVDGGEVDAATAINTSLSTLGYAWVPSNVTLAIESEIVIPNGGRVFGSNWLSSQIILVGNIDGLRIGRYSALENIRVIGNGSMGVGHDGRKKACVNLGYSGGYDSARSRISRCIIGGRSGALGDSVNARCTGVGIKTHNAFLNTVADCYIPNCDIGADGRYISGQTHNAFHWQQTEFQFCRVGQIAAVLNGVTWDTCTWEGCDMEGLILGSSRSATLTTPYFEGNNKFPDGNKQADLWIEGASAVVGIDDVGSSIQILSPQCFGNVNSEYGIYADRQRMIEIRGGTFRDYPTDKNVIKIGTNSTTGLISGQSINNAANVDVPWWIQRGGLVRTGQTLHGWQPIVDPS